MTFLKFSVFALTCGMTICMSPNSDAGVIQGESFDYTKFEFTNGGQDFTSDTYKFLFRSKFSGRTTGISARTTAWDSGIKPLDFSGNPLVSDTGGAFRSHYTPFSPTFGNQISGVRKTGLTINVSTPKIVSNLQGGGTDKLYGTIDFKINQSNGAQLSNLGAVPSNLSGGGTVDPNSIVALGNGWQRAAFTLPEADFAGVGPQGERNGRNVNFRFNFTDSVTDLLIDNVVISKDVPDLYATADLYPIRIDGNVYYVRKGFKNFDGAYDSDGQLVNVSEEVAGKLLQASSALQSVADFDSTEVSKLLTQAYRNDIIADFSETTRQALTTAAGSVISSSFSPSGAATLIENALDAGSITLYASTEAQIRLLTGLALEVTDQHLDVISEARERFLGQQKVVIDFEQLKEVDAHTVRGIEASRALTNMFIANANLPESLGEGLYKAFGDLTLATLGPVGAGLGGIAQGFSTYDEFVEALDNYHAFLTQTSLPVTDSRFLEDFSEEALKKISGNSTVDQPLGRTYVSLEEFWSTFGLTPEVSSGNEKKLLTLEENTMPTITFGGEGIGALVDLGSLAPTPGLSLTYGSPVSALIEDIAIPENDFLISFDYLWSSTSGSLDIFLNEILIDTLFAPSELQQDYSTHSIFLLASDFFGINFADLLFYSDGPTGERLLLSNLALTELNSSTGTEATEVPASQTIMLFLLSFCVLCKRKLHFN